MGFLEDRDFTGIPTIPEFYKGKSVFITGGSGFMGKVLIEKLLYSCSDLQTIYLLLRSKRGVDAENRLAKLYSSACFDRLRNEKPNIFKSKVCIIPGNIIESGLGISEEDRNLLINHVNIVFHMAASVRFNDTLKYAVRINVSGTKTMLDLAKDMKNLCAFIHLSTAYTNTDKNPVEEIIYPPHAIVNDTLAICKNIDEDILKVLTPKYIGELPNTYAFSKQLAEHVVYETKGQLPAVIIRPSIVLPSVEEPVPGWIDNFNGPIGVICGSATSVIRTLFMNPDTNCDYMPVDLSIKNIIISSWIRGTKSLKPTDDIPIYNCCNGNISTMSISTIIRKGYQILSEVPLGPGLWHPYILSTESKIIHYFMMILQQLLPAIFIDLLLKAVGRKPMLVKLQRRIYTALTALIYYTTQEWTFENKNFLLLPSYVKDKDMKSFYYNVEAIDIDQYTYNFMKGARKYLLKLKDEDLIKHRNLYKRMYYLHVIVLCIFWSFTLWYILSSNYVQSIATQII